MIIMKEIGIYFYGVKIFVALGLNQQLVHTWFVIWMLWYWLKSQVDSFMTSVYLLLETHGQSERSYDIHVLTCTGIICLKPIMQHWQWVSDM